MQAGFWSFTVYAADNYLVPNAGNVYALGDRSGITYPGGGRVYPLSATNMSTTMSNGSGQASFQILIQAADVLPPANWTSNWLPSPSGGGGVVPLLRWYGATPALTQGAAEGGYVYPVVTRQGAVRAVAAGGVNATTTGAGTTTGATPTSSRPAGFTGGAGAGPRIGGSAVVGAGVLGALVGAFF